MPTHSHAAIYTASARGQVLVEKMQAKMAFPKPHRAINIVRRAFLGDDDMRDIVEVCCGPVEWMEEWESLKIVWPSQED
jgi:hypothetical protein